MLDLRTTSATIHRAVYHMYGDDKHKSTEQNLFADSDKSATDIHETSCGLFATAELLVCTYPSV